MTEPNQEHPAVSKARDLIQILLATKSRTESEQRMLDILVELLREYEKRKYQRLHGEN